MKDKMPKNETMRDICLTVTAIAPCERKERSGNNLAHNNWRWKIKTTWMVWCGVVSGDLVGGGELDSIRFDSRRGRGLGVGDR